MCAVNNSLNNAINITLDLAKSLAESTEFVPVAAAVLDEDDKIISLAHNKFRSTEHAEINAINMAFEYLEHDLKFKVDKLRGCTIITTLEPCIMCAGAILNSQFKKVVYLTRDEKFGAGGSVWDLLRDPLSSHHPEVVYLQDESSEIAKSLLQNWFKILRERK